MTRRVFRLGIGRGHIAREVDDELSFHLEMRVQKLMAAGLSPDAARQEAHRQFGDLERVRQLCVVTDQERERTMHRAHVLEELRNDFVHALRMLRNNLGFTTVVVITLALGIGANTAIFTLVNAVLLRTLPVRAPEELVAIGDPARTSSLSQSDDPGHVARTDLISYPLYVDLKNSSSHLVTGLLASGRSDRLDALIDAKNVEPEHPRGRYVSGNYFKVLGVPAHRGRVFDGGEDRLIGGSPVVTISHSYWTRRFNSDPKAIGRTVRVNGTALTIIGVTPPSFTGEIVGTETDIWIPVTMQSTLMPNQRLLEDRQSDWLLLLGRLAPAVTLGKAQAAFTPLIRQTLKEHATEPGAAQRIDDMRVWVSSGAKGFSRVRSTYGAPLVTLMVGVGLLLLIVCANVANLLLARSVARSREMAVRLAIGAGRLRLVRQLLTESILLALIGAGAGLLIAWWGSQLLLALAADGSSAIPLQVRLDLPVLGFTAGVSVLAVALFGLVPAMRGSRVDLASTMRAHARSVTGSSGGRGQRVPLGKMLIAGQVALSLVLLVGAALLVRSLQSLQNADTGLDRDHLLIVDVDVIGRGYTGTRLMTLAQELSGRFARIPGVAAVSYSENGIFSGTESASTLQIAGFVARTHEDTVAAADQIGPGYVRAIGARLLEGREFLPNDDDRASPVAIVNETMARFFFGKESALGRTMRVDTVAIEIVGVIADTKDHQLGGESVRRFYLPYLQHPVGESGSLRFEVRATGDPAALNGPVRREIAAVDPQLPIDGADALSFLMRQSIREERLLARLSSGFGILALLLAAVGLYGVMTYAITRRTGEIGLRVALGAQRREVIGMVLADAMRLVVLGVVIGVPLCYGAARLLNDQLHGISAMDPASIVVALVVLLASAIAAALFPAIRASRVAPLVALRQE